MDIKIKDTLVLDDDNEYIVISKINNDNVYYFYLLNKKNKEEKFCYQKNFDLVEITDKDLITKLLPLFLEEAKKVVK